MKKKLLFALYVCIYNIIMSRNENKATLIAHKISVAKNI